MIEEVKEEGMVKKVGGRVKFSTLLQKRLEALNKGSRPLVELDTKDKMTIAIQEILQDKIYLDSSNEVKITGEIDDGGGLPDLNPMDLCTGAS